jgi:HAD superfamily hydrolase (TIGR01509 family)
VSPVETRAAAVLFDLDGLLVDSEPVWYAAEAEVVAQLGGEWNHEHQAALVGGTLDAGCRYMLELTGSDVSVEELRDRLLDRMVTHFRGDLPVHAGALELVDSVRDRGVPTGLVSSSYRLLVDAALDRLGAERFDVTVAGDEVAAGKPQPDPYLLACRELAVAPGRTVVLEDADAGVRSAEAAGCTVVAIPSVRPIVATPTRPVLTSLNQIDPDWLLALPCS